MKERKWFKDHEGGDMEVSDHRGNWHGNSWNGSGSKGDRWNQNDSTQSSGSASTNAGWSATPYVESDLVKQAQSLLQQHMANQPGQYTSQWSGQLTDMLGQIQNRPEFKYDINSDALWNQYKDQYTQLGQQAMMDTMGQAAALTGGYGNSYAQSVGQQAYQNYLQGLTDKVPELYQLALNRYQMDSTDLMNKYGLLASAEDQEYGRYMDAVNQYYAQMDRLQNRYDTERNWDYAQYIDDRDFGYGQYIDDRNYQYQTERDAVADRQWQAQFDEALRQFNFANKLGEFAEEESSGGGGGDDEDSGSGTYTPPKPSIDIAGEYIALKQAGGAKEADTYLKSAVDGGFISLSDATELRNSRY